MSKKRWMIAGGMATLIVCTSCFFWLVRKKSSELPNEQLSSARLAILDAKKQGADVHSRFEYELAVASYDSAIKHWGSENRRMLIFRNFDKAKRFAFVSDSLARISIKHSVGVVDDARSIFFHRYELAKKKMELLKLVNTRFKIPDDLNASIRKLNTDFSGLTLIKDEGRWVEGERRSSEILARSNTILKQSHEFLYNYFSQYKNWQRLAKDAVEQSRKRKAYVMVVDKMAEELQLFYAGRQINTYAAEFGQNWIGDKQYEGDKSTPEGSYAVISKKQGRQTRYYKALGINYPNDHDKERFNTQKQNGTIAASRRIGGLIEIHGEGGKGFHWTDGCIALKNEDMDIIFHLIPVNTEVVIVGSLRPLEELIEL